MRWILVAALLATAAPASAQIEPGYTMVPLPAVTPFPEPPDAGQRYGLGTGGNISCCSFPAPAPLRKSGIEPVDRAIELCRRRALLENLFAHDPDWADAVQACHDAKALYQSIMGRYGDLSEAEVETLRSNPHTVDGSGP